MFGLKPGRGKNSGLPWAIVFTSFKPLQELQCTAKRQTVECDLVIWPRLGKPAAEWTDNTVIWRK